MGFGWHCWPLATFVCALLGSDGEVGNYAVYLQPSSGMLRQPTVWPLSGLAIERVWGLAAVP